MEIEKKNGITVVVMDERVQAVLGRELKDMVYGMGEQNEIKLVIDLAKTSFIDSSASGALVACWRFAKKTNGDMKIASPSSHVKSLFRLTRLDTVVEIFDDLDSALKSFSQTG
jgi:anti-sigma B factor antagonist